MHVAFPPAGIRIAAAALLTLSVAMLAGCGATTSVSSSAAPTPTPLPTATATPDPTATWIAHSSAPAQVTFRYDPSWQLAECDPGAQYSWGVDPGPVTTIYLGSPSRQAPLAECPVENESPEMVIDSAPGATPYSAFVPASCGGVRTAPEPVNVDGVTGVRIETTFTGTYRCIGAPALRDVTYTFSTHGRSYGLEYAYRQGDAGDLTSSFDLVVQHTLTFSAP